MTEIALGARAAGGAERQRREAEDAARQAELERLRRLTVRQLSSGGHPSNWRASIGPNGKPSGRKDGGAYVRQQFERHIFPVIGDVAVEDLRKADLMAIFDTHKARGQVAHGGGAVFRPQANASVRGAARNHPDEPVGGAGAIRRGRNGR